MKINSTYTETDPSLAVGVGKNRKTEAALAVASDAPSPTARAADVLTLSAETTPPASYTKPRAVTPPAEPPAAGGTSGAGDAPPAQASPGAAQASPVTDGVTYGQTELDSLLASFGASQGQAHFNEASDLNGDGLVNFDDLNRLLSNFAPAAPAAVQAPPSPPSAAKTPIASAAAEPEAAPVATPSVATTASTSVAAPSSTPETAAASAPLAPEAGQTPAAASPAGQTDVAFDQSELPSLLFAYGSRFGESGFDARFDFNSDGVIGFDDLNTALSSIAPGAAQHASTLEGLVNAFGLNQGEEGFSPEFDFDGDGFVGFADLNRLLDDLFTQQQ